MWPWPTRAPIDPYKQYPTIAFPSYKLLLSYWTLNFPFLFLKVNGNKWLVIGDLYVSGIQNKITETCIYLSLNGHCHEYMKMMNKNILRLKSSDLQKNRLKKIFDYFFVNCARQYNALQRDSKTMDRQFYMCGFVGSNLLYKERPLSISVLLKAIDGDGYTNTISNKHIKQRNCYFEIAARHIDVNNTYVRNTIISMIILMKYKRNLFSRLS